MESIGFRRHFLSSTEEPGVAGTVFKPPGGRQSWIARVDDTNIKVLSTGREIAAGEATRQARLPEDERTPPTIRIHIYGRDGAGLWGLTHELERRCRRCGSADHRGRGGASLGPGSRQPGPLHLPRHVCGAGSETARGALPTAGQGDLQIARRLRGGLAYKAGVGSRVHRWGDRENGYASTGGDGRRR
jgi:hypothetical protein